MIWDKLFSRSSRKEQAAGNTLLLDNRLDKSTDKRSDKRRGPRVLATMPVFVYGRAQGRPFSEQSETTNVSPQGGLLRLSAELERFQPLLVTNLQTDEELACRVARLTKTDNGKTLVGLEFLRPSPGFWSIDFQLRPSR
jgi:hypothetical protein